MRFPAPLTEGRLVRRYKRFLADVEFADGTARTVHCPNPGAMTGLTRPGMRVFLSRSDKAGRRLPWSWEIVEAGSGLVGINSAFANRIAGEALAGSAIAELAGCGRVRSEVRYGDGSRVDFVLSRAGRADTYLEVKSVTLSRRPGAAEFPDCVTVRGARHLAELARVAAGGGGAAMLYVVQRNDADRFALARDIDPGYAAAFDRGKEAGVAMLAYACDLSPDGISLARPIPVVG